MSPPEKHIEKLIEMESAMRSLLTTTALGVVLVAGISAAQAQTVITAPAPTIQTTTETVRTVRPAPRTARREVVTTRTVTRQVAAPAALIAGPPVAPQPLYDEAAPAPLAADADYRAPLYDAAVLPAGGPAPWVGPAGVSSPYIYRYVYEPDRILVIDPTTNITVQALPR
jgi:hypothetical protein